MALPTLSVPEYITKLPSTGEEVKYRPYLVKEKKVLLVAINTGDKKQIINALKNVIGTCVKSKTKVKEMSIFDIEYLFIKLRAKSDGEEVELELLCEDDGQTRVPVKIDLDKFEVNFPENHTNIIETDQLKFVMRYPNMDVVMNMDTEDEDALNSPDNIFNMLMGCIKEVYYEEECYTFHDYTKDEKTEFLEQLSSKDYTTLMSFFEKMPRLEHTVKFKNPKTKKMNKYTIEGINDFL